METERRKRRWHRRLTRILSWVTGISVGGVALISIAILLSVAVFVRTDYFQTHLRDRVLQLAREEVDARILFDRAEVDVFSLEPKIHFYKVRFEQEANKVSVGAERFSVSISVFSLPLLAFRQLVLSSLELEGLDYDLSDTNVIQKWAKAVRPRRSLIPVRFQTSIQRVHLAHVNFRVNLSESDIFKTALKGQVSIDSLQLGLFSDRVEVSGLTNLKNFSIGAWGPYDAQLILDRASLKGEKLQFRKLELLRGSDIVSLSGVVERFADPRLSVKGNADLDLGFYLNRSLEGRLRADFFLEGPLKELQGEGSLKMQKAHWGPKLFDELESQWALEANILNLKTLSWKDREESGRGQMQLNLTGNHLMSCDVEVSKSNLGTYFPLLTPDLKNWGGEASGKVVFSGRVEERLEGDFDLNLNVKDFAIRAATTPIEILKVPEVQLKAKGGVQGFSGQADLVVKHPQSDWTGNISWNQEGLRLNWNSTHRGGYFGDLFGMDLQPLGTIPGTFGGPWAHLKMLAQPNLKSFKIYGQEVHNLRGNLILENRRLRGEPLIADELNLTGGLHFNEKTDYEFDNLDFRVKGIGVQQVFKFIHLSPKDILFARGEASGGGKLNGQLMSPSGSGFVRVEKWSFGEKAVGHLATADWASSKGQLFLEGMRFHLQKTGPLVEGDLAVDGRGVSDLSLHGKKLRVTDWAYVLGFESKLQSKLDFNLDYQRDLPSIVAAFNLSETSFDGVAQPDSNISYEWIKNEADLKARLLGDSIQILGKSRSQQKKLQSSFEVVLKSTNLAPILGLSDSARLEILLTGAGNFSSVHELTTDTDWPVLAWTRPPIQSQGKLLIEGGGIQRTNVILQKIEPIEFILSHSGSNLPRLTFSKMKVRSEGHVLEISGTIDASKKFHFELDGELDLRAAAALHPLLSRSDGILEVHGRAEETGFTGSLLVKRALLTLQGSNVVVKDVEAALRADRSSFELSRFSGNFRDGVMTGSGRFRLTEEGIESAKLGIQLDRIYLQPDDGIGLRASGPLDLVVNQGKGEINGKLFINEGLFRRRIDLRSDLMNFFEDEKRLFRPPDVQEGNWKKWKLNVQVNSAEAFSIRNNIGDGAVNFNLLAGGTVAEPHIKGSVQIIRGQFNFNNRQFTVRSGAVQFQNPNSNVPNYDIRADTDIADYRVSMRLQGGPGQQKIMYSSDPALSEKDIITLISFGLPASADELKGEDPQRSLSFTGLSFVTGGIQDKIESRLSEDLGIQRFQIQPAFFEETGRTELQFVLGTDIIRNKLSVNYSNFLTAPGGHKVELDLKVNRNVSLIGSWRDVRQEEQSTGPSTDDFGGDLRFRFEFE